MTRKGLLMRGRFLFKVFVLGGSMFFVVFLLLKPASSQQKPSNVSTLAVLDSSLIANLLTKNGYLSRRNFRELSPAGHSPKAAQTKIKTREFPKQLDTIQDFYNYLTELEYDCSKYIRIGKLEDGGWNACLDKPYQLKAPCLVYSFGIRYDWSFDEAVASQHGCEVQSFDPSIGLPYHHHDAMVNFNPVGLGDADEINSSNWTMKRLSTIFLEKGHVDRVIDYLKIDIDLGEWKVLPDLFSSNVLRNIKQIGIEIHIYPYRLEMLNTMWYPLLREFADHGFKRWSFHENGKTLVRQKTVRTSNCIELYYVNTNFIDNGAKYGDMVDEEEHFTLTDVSEKAVVLIPVEKHLKMADITCPHYIVIRNVSVCMTEQFKPEEPCLVITFDRYIRYNYEFDDMFSTLLHHCEMHTFLEKAQEITYARSPEISIYAGDFMQYANLSQVITTTRSQEMVIDLLRIHISWGSRMWHTMDKLAKDPLIVLVKQLLVDIPIYQGLDFLSEILYELIKIGFRKWSCDEFPQMSPTHYRVAFLNIRHIPQEKIKYINTW